MTEPITPEYRRQMQELAAFLDHQFNGDAKGADRKVCFVLLISEFGTEGRTNYISNGQRSDIVTLFKELIARFEGQPEIKGRA